MMTGGGWHWFRLADFGVESRDFVATLLINEFLNPIGIPLRWSLSSFCLLIYLFYVDAPIHWIGGYFSGVKRPGREADLSPTA
jgi:hypothetical protein